MADIIEKIILGIDPGTNIMGYGLISCKGTLISPIKLGILKIDSKKEQLPKLKQVFDCVSSLIIEFKPTTMAIEAPFFGKNVQSMLKLGRAQGIAIAAALHHDLDVFEYSPTKVKMAITGKGSASKEQVAQMLSKLMLINQEIPSLDATDALAIAYCHYLQKNKVSGSTSYSGWGSFVAKNTNRIIK